jgi:hypothetical protein
MPRYRATLVLEYEADDLADAVETLEEVKAGGIGMAPVMVERSTVTRWRPSRAKA